MHLRKAKPQALPRRTFRFRAADVAADGTFSGYGSVFGAVDTYDSVMMPGCFAASLERHAAEGTMPSLLWQHLPEEPLGPWIEMREDARGLFVRGQLLQDVARAREARALMMANALNGLSIGFEEVRTENINATQAREILGLELPAGANLVLMHEVDLWECSIVTFPSCAPARVDEVRRKPLAAPATPAARATPRPFVPAPRAGDLFALSAALAARGRALSRL